MVDPRITHTAFEEWEDALILSFIGGSIVASGKWCVLEKMFNYKRSQNALRHRFLGLTKKCKLGLDFDQSFFNVPLQDDGEHGGFQECHDCAESLFVNELPFQTEKILAPKLDERDFFSCKKKVFYLFNEERVKFGFEKSQHLII